MEGRRDSGRRSPGDKSPGYIREDALRRSDVSAFGLKPGSCFGASAPKPEGRLSNVARAFRPGRWVALLLVFLAALLSGCASEHYARPSEGLVQRGIASWYGPGFHGKKTASGEIYDMDGMTAAHKELPLGTIVHVTNLDNGKTVQVRVNDRGPYIRGRILDLSRAAAAKIDMIGTGLARIEMRVVQVGAGRPGPTRLTRYTVQVGAFREQANAVAAQEKLRDFPVKVQQHGDLYRVRIGLYSQRDEAEEVRRELARLGVEAVIIPIN